MRVLGDRPGLSRLLVILNEEWGRRLYAGWCAPSTAAIRPNAGVTSYFTCSPRSQGVWFAAAAQSDVATVRFSLSDGRPIRVPAVGIAGGKACVFAVANGVRVLSWTALDAAGKQVGTGPGWKCG